MTLDMLVLLVTAVAFSLLFSSFLFSSSGFRVHWPASFDPTRRSISTSGSSIPGPPLTPLPDVPPLPFPDPYESTVTKWKNRTDIGMSCIRSVNYNMEEDKKLLPVHWTCYTETTHIGTGEVIGLAQDAPDHHRLFLVLPCPCRQIQTHSGCVPRTLRSRRGGNPFH